MAQQHTYRLRTVWTGNLGSGTSSYRAYSRDHEVTGAGKAVVIPGSSDPKFRGDASRYSPEELLVSSLSSCHMLWVLHLCADAGIVVTAYEDEAVGVMQENADGSGEFVEVVLQPELTITDPARTDELQPLHECAHSLCFIARSVKFPVHVRPRMQAVKSL